MSTTMIVLVFVDELFFRVALFLVGYSPLLSALCTGIPDVYRVECSFRYRCSDGRGYYMSQLSIHWCFMHNRFVYSDILCKVVLYILQFI